MAKAPWKWIPWKQWRLLHPLKRKLFTSKPRKPKSLGSERIPNAPTTTITAVRAPKSIVYRIKKGRRPKKGHIV